MRRSMTREDEDNLIIDLRRGWQALYEGQCDPVTVYQTLVDDIGDSLKSGLGLNGNGNSRFDRDEFYRRVYIDFREAQSGEMKPLEEVEDL